MRITLLLGIFFLLLTLFLIPKQDIVQTPPGSNFPCVRYDKLVGHSYQPNCKGFGSRGRSGAEISHNSLGLRDREFSPKPEKNVYRILILGSSNLYGNGIDISQTTTKVLEETLRKVKGCSIEIINGGKEGYFTLQHELGLEELLKKSSPNMVILNWMARDGFFKDAVYYWAAEKNTDGSVVKIRSNPSERFGWIGEKLFTLDPPGYFFWHSLVKQIDYLALTIFYYFTFDHKAELVTSPSLESAMRIKSIASKYGSSFYIIDTVKGASNRIYLGFGSKRIISALFSRLTPPIEIRRDQIETLYPRQIRDSLLPVDKKILFELDQPVSRFENDIHLDAVGSKIYAKLMQRSLEPVLKMTSACIRN